MTRKQSMIWLSTSSLWLQSACKIFFYSSQLSAPQHFWHFFLDTNDAVYHHCSQLGWWWWWSTFPLLIRNTFSSKLTSNTHTSAHTHPYLRHTFESYFLIIQKSVSLYFLFFKLTLLLSPPFFFCLSIPEKVLWGTYFSVLWNYNYQEK